MSQLPGNGASRSEHDDYLPARMLNEFVYCPRLFFYEHVDSQFVHNRETTEGALRHSTVDGGSGELASPAELPPDEVLHARSVTLSSESHRLIAKMDLVEADGQRVIPIDYKRGSPRRIDAADKSESAPLQIWDADRVQLAVQALVLRENGYTCDEAMIYYVSTKQRVRLPIDDALLEWTLKQLQAARGTAAAGVLPPPLVDSPKCPRCSLVGICLPDETHSLQRQPHGKGYVQRSLFPDADEAAPTPRTAPSPQTNGEADSSPAEPPSPRRLVPARDDLRPLYLNTQGLRVGKSGYVLKVHEKEKLLQEVRINEICQLNLFGNIQLTTQALQALCEQEVPIAYFSFGGWFYGLTHGLGVRNIYLRREQFRLADVPAFSLRIARSLVAGKIRNQRTLLQRNHLEPPAAALVSLRSAISDAERAESLEELLGIEGNAARIYFQNFAGMIKVDEPTGVPVHGRESPLQFDFAHRNRRPPRDRVNALLSLAYSLMSKDLTIVCQVVGFDPFLGFYHQPRFGRAALALDLMEPFRPLIADSAVLTAINTRMVTPLDFVRAGDSVALKPEGRKAFFRAYEQRMDSLVTHPIFGYRVSYRRILEIQARLLARVLTGELKDYPPFVTR